MSDSGNWGEEEELLQRKEEQEQEYVEEVIASVEGIQLEQQQEQEQQEQQAAELVYDEPVAEQAEQQEQQQEYVEAQAEPTVVPAQEEPVQTTTSSAPVVNISGSASAQQAVIGKFARGAPSCALCKRSVYPVEKVQAIDQTWHKTCFTCGGNGNEGCKKVLTLDNYVDHGPNPFCKGCHNKLFGLKGFGYGLPGHVLHNYPDAEGATTAPTVQTTSTTLKIAKPAAVASKFGEGAPKCTVCAKSVYAAEKVQAVDRIWHKTCFTCGGTSNDGGCKKTLTLDSYLTHGVDPFCKPCHGKLFGPKDLVLETV